MSWREFLHGHLTSEATREEGFIVKVFVQSPTLYYIEEADGVSELHADDGHGTCKRVVMSMVFHTWRHTTS